MFAAAAGGVKLTTRIGAVNEPSPPPPLRARALALERLRWVNDYARLPAPFHTRLAPTPLPAPYLVDVSADAAALLGFDAADDDPAALRDALVGNRALAGAEPLAAVYAGHQFGVYVPQLGDGRAHLLGGVVGADGAVWELQLKGSGRTPYSRAGDGRAVLRSSIREYLCSEAMHALGIPTTRALAIVGSDYPVFRETVETAAVVTRLAPSFVRFGTFEFFYWRGWHDPLRRLADYVIDAFFPACRAAPQPYLALLDEVARRTARLIALWQGVGFCHGVMNTDNMSILGLTIDYGPFGFIDGFDAGHICNHSDEHGRYAYGMQPRIAHWNLYCLGQALLPLTGDAEQTRAVLDGFEVAVQSCLDDVWHAKLGLATRAPQDRALIEDLLALLHANRVDWTIFWRGLSQLKAADPAADAPLAARFADGAAFAAWAERYRARLRAEASDDAERAARMNRVNPKFVLRNHLAEIAIARARGDDGERDYAELRRLLAVLRRPYDEQPQFERYAAPPPEWAKGLHLSCSS
jgi:uncharacterized protein YdiU (UPF0061 family)